MDGPYHRSYWDLPSRPRPRQSPSVREIPVQFVESEEPRDRSASAVKIQKVFRGFLVRKSVKKIVQLGNEVEEIEKRISDKKTVDLIRRELKERLKVNEMLMSLLFKLDSVRGVDTGVRDCRKAVIKKAIALQEILDAIVSNNGDHCSNNAVDNDEKVVEVVEQTAMECTKDAENYDSPDPNAVVSIRTDQVSDDAVDNTEKVLEVVDQTMVACKEEGEKFNTEGVDDETDISNHENDDVAGEAVGSYDVMPDKSKYLGVSEESSQTESQSDSSSNPQNLIQACEGNCDPSLQAETHQAENKEVTDKESCGSGTEEDNKNRDLLEKMIEDNQKMMGMMSQLFERNEMQTRLLSALSQRVEQLEKAFVWDRLRKKKKRHAAGTVDGSETTPDGKKCGKR